ncbi:hypothetical protein O6H91_12G028000 [Diphasiastrum complanatum]|uniref:Uncharacterized protein n=1 Tax=Diphasiastrum complanatum TaxID=34168 RepID=A0ACC2C063_DIPCM|nr:hypothetical protein O6H91_12G028000 [Diphasiastrum complanatum]
MAMAMALSLDRLLLHRPEAAACSALCSAPSSSAHSSPQRKGGLTKRLHNKFPVSLMVQQRADIAVAAASLRSSYASSVAAAAVAGFVSAGLVAEDEPDLLEKDIEGLILGREWEVLRTRLTALERSLLEAQWCSLSAEKVWHGDTARTAEYVEQNGGFDIRLRAEGSALGATMEAVRSGRPSARKRRLKARQEAGLGYARLSPAVYPKHATMFESFVKEEKHVRGKGKVSRGFQAFFLRDTKKKQLTDGEQRILWGKMRSANHLMEGKKRLQRQLGSEPSKGTWALYMSISQQELVKTLRDAKSAQNKLVNANLRLVVATARRYQNLGMDFADLIQEGTIGLVKGVEKFDSTRGYKFSTYAHWWILQGITRALARMSRAIRLPYHLHETVCRIRKIQSFELGTEPDTLENLSKALNLPSARVQVALQASNYKLKSMDEPLSRDQDTRDTLHNVVADPRKENQPWRVVEKAYAKENFENYVKVQLQPRELEIIRLRYGLNQQYVYPLTREHIGAVCGLSRERVRQLERIAMCKLMSSKKELSLENLNIAFC